VLTGAVNPSGHLPLTWPASLAQLPHPQLPGADVPAPPKGGKTNYGIASDKIPFAFGYKEGSDVGYRWFDRTKAQPLYAFGHGLSYTDFKYDKLSARGGKGVSVTFTVTNTGAREGADVPQVYVVRPGKAKRLVGWDRSVLAPGQTKQVTVTADPRLLADFDEQKKAWVIPAGEYRVEVARSAAEPVLTGSVKVAARQFPAQHKSR
jgi:beta-glucosidase